MTYAIINGTIYLENKTIKSGYIVVSEGKILEVAEGVYRGELTTIDAQGLHVLPGFIDIHIHGGYGEDAMDASREGLQHLSRSLLSEGTTSYLATTMTQSDENITRALNVIGDYRRDQALGCEAEILGIHLEGPFISEHKVGAQNPAYVQRPTLEKMNVFQEQSRNSIKVVTIAPEVDNATEVIHAFQDEIIFSVGHSVAIFDEVNQAVEQGLRHATHLYNAASPFEHRHPGVFGAAWTNDQLHAEVIVDGVHTHPAAIQIAYRLKGNQGLYLITDAMRAKGMPEGHYDLGGQDVQVQGSEARLSNGALAGSILKMNEGLERLKQFTGESLEDLWRITSLNQAIALNIVDQKGSIKEGKDADLVLVDDSTQVIKTIKAGHVHSF